MELSEDEFSKYEGHTTQRKHSMQRHGSKRPFETQVVGWREGNVEKTG